MHKILRRAGVETHALTLPGHGAAPEDLIGVRAESWLTPSRRNTAKWPVATTRCTSWACAWAGCWRWNCASEKTTARAGWCRWPPRVHRRLEHALVPRPAPPGLPHSRAGRRHAGRRGRTLWPEERAGPLHRQGQVRAWRELPLPLGAPVLRPGGRRLRGWVMRGLDAIACPTLIMHAHEDELTSARSAHFLRDGIADSRLVLLDNSYHMICVDNDRDRVAAEVLRFMDRPKLPSRAGCNRWTARTRNACCRPTASRCGRASSRPCSPVRRQRGLDRGRRQPAQRRLSGKSALIDLFSRLMDYSRNTLRILEVGAPEPRGRALPCAALPGPGRSRPAGKRRDPYAAAARQCHHPRQFRGGRSAARGRAMAQAGGRQRRGAGGRRHGSADASDPGRGTGRRLRGRHDRTAHAATAAIGRRANPAAGV